MAIALTSQLTGRTFENLPVETRYPNKFLNYSIDRIVTGYGGIGGRLPLDWLVEQGYPQCYQHRRSRSRKKNNRSRTGGRQKL